MAFISVLRKLAEKSYTAVDPYEDQYSTPDNPVEAFSKASPADRRGLYMPAVKAVRSEGKASQMSLADGRNKLTLRPGEETFAPGKLFEKLPEGYTHRTDKTFMDIMDNLISLVEGGVSKGVRNAEGKLVMRPTNRGVEDKFYREFLRKRNLTEDVPVTDLSEADTRAMLYRDLWKHYNLDKVKDPTAAALIFDSALNSGHRAIGNLVKQHIPRDILGISGEPTTFGDRAANIFNAISEKGTPEERDQMVVNLLKQRRKIMETAPNFYSPELGAGLRNRLKKIEEYIKSNLRNPELMESYYNDGDSPSAQSFFRSFRDRYRYNPQTGSVASDEIS